MKNTNNNRRLTDDRRNEEAGPPNGWKERRRTVERRKPDVVEASLDEWHRLLQQRAEATLQGEKKDT